MIKLIDLDMQLKELEPAIINRIKSVLAHGQYIMGPEVYELEEKLANFVGVKHCISCANGTDALQLSLMSCGIGNGDIVFVPSFSFFATAEVIPLVGATPYFCDIDLKTYNLCPKSLEKAIQQSKNINGTPKAVIAVDLFGLPANYPALQDICDRYGLLLIEDAAQSFGASLDGKKCGSFGNIATTSFFPSKPLGCYGDGGAIFTNDDQLAELCRSLRSHGKGSHKYENIRIGLNSRLDTIQAAVLLEKLSIFDEELLKRQLVAKRYIEALQNRYQLEIPAGIAQSAWAQFTIRHSSLPREQIQANLLSKDISSMIYYPTPIHKAEPMNSFPATDMKNTCKASNEVISIPISPYISEGEQHHIIQTLLI